MSSTRLATTLIGIAVATCALAADEPTAAEKAQTPFWKAPVAELDLRSLVPARVTMVTAPQRVRNFALLQTGPDAPPFNYVPTNPTVLPFLPGEDLGYRVVAGGLKLGSQPYGDRTYQIKKLDPAFSGLTLLQIRNGDKAVVDGRYSVVVSAANPCLVFVVLDERSLETYEQHGIPAWLHEYVPTGHKIGTDDPIMAQTGAEYLVFVRKSPAGRIALGPPGLDISLNSMYFAFFAETK